MNFSSICSQSSTPTVDIFNNKIKPGIVNPLTVRTYQQVLNINSRFRDNYNMTKSSNFTIHLPTPMNKVISMKLINSLLQSTVHSINETHGSHRFYINDTEIKLPNGSYDDPRVMADELTKIITLKNIHVKVSYNGTQGTMTFSSTADPPTEFSMDFNTNNNIPVSSNLNRDHLTLGWVLGFRGNYLEKAPSITTNKYIKNKSQCCPEIIRNNDYLDNFYNGKTSYTGEAIFDNHGNTSFLLSVDDYQNNSNKTFITPFKYQSINEANVLAKIDLTKNYMVDYPARIYFGPTDITKLTIRLYDEYGRIIDNNNSDYSIELLFECVYEC